MPDIVIRKKKSIFTSFIFLIFTPFAVFILAILAYLNYFKLNMPLHTIIMCAVLLCFAIFFAPQNEYCVYAKIKKNSQIFQNDLKEFIKLHSLTINKESKSNADFDKFLDEYLHNLKPLSFGYIASAVFPMLGILGTFISIAISMPDFKSNNTNVLENEISQLLDGIATAFYVSIYGIFLTIWWMFFSRLGLSKINYFKENFKYKSQKYFWSKEELERINIKKNYDLLDKTSILIEKLNDNEFFTQLNKLHQEKFISFSKLFASYEKIAIIHTQLAQKSLEISEQNNEEIQKKLNNFINKIENSIEQFQKIKDELSNNLFDFKANFEAEENDFKIVDNIKQDIENISKEASEVLNKISNAK